MVGQNVFQYSEHNHDEDKDTEKKYINDAAKIRYQNSWCITTR